MPVCWLRSPTCHETISLESASRAVHVHTSPAASGAAFANFGARALRVSNDFATGGFGDQILAPLSEEICFRGMLFGGFRTRFNLPVAAIGAGLVFGALHFSTGPSAVPQLMVLGAIFAVVYDRTESIWPPIIFHAINNAYVLIVLNS